MNEIFADPRVIKVFHGANMDIKWLQRDFGIYVVNLFDTYKGIQHLNRSPFTFASLLFRYTGEITDKEYQLADWRIRPLKEEMIKYARRDTHYLLYIYDCLRKDIIEEALKAGRPAVDDLKKVFEFSKETSLIVYHKPQTFNRQYHTLYGTQKHIWNDNRMELFTELWVNSLHISNGGTKRREKTTNQNRTY